ncbi:MAG: MFS transporter [Anaerolineales bacterium]
MSSNKKSRWFVLAVFFAFMLLHQSDRLLIAPLTTPIMETFGINEAQMGAVVTGALLVGAFLYPIWGYLYDRFSRPKLLALASAIWGATTWLSAIAPTYKTFLATRASTGIDDSSYPGLYSLLSDYFKPSVRGKVYGFLQLSQPLGYMLGLVVATFFASSLGWRNIFYVTGSLGLILAVIIFFTVREAPRGSSEPELEGLEDIGVYKFDRKHALGLFRKRSILLLFAQGFVGVFPWNVITFWFFRYLEVERGFDESAILLTLGPTILVLAFGYFLGGAVGDFAFKRTPRGRLLVAMVAVLVGAVLLTITMNVPIAERSLFMIMLILTALFIPFASANVVSTIHDVALPEIRSTALAIQLFIENGGAALAPFIAGLIAVRYSLHDAILWICLIAWVLGAIILAFAAYKVPEDISSLREEMRARAQTEQEAQALGNI